MSRGTYNYTPSSNRGNDVNAPSHPHFWNRLPPVPRRSASTTGGPPVQVQDPRGGTYDPWLPYDQDSATRRPFPFTRPTSPHPHVHIIVLDNDLPRSTNPRSRVLPLPYSPPTYLSHINEQVPREEYSNLTADEQKETLSKLRKETYNPVLKRPNKPNYYVRDWAIISSRREKEKENDQDGKRCAVCLEDFEPKEAVTLTPCNHMFHEDCIVPWVKSQGRCPVCRFAICERMGEGAAGRQQGNGNAEIGRDGLVERELISVIRAMEEAFEWDNVRQFH